MSAVRPGTLYGVGVGPGDPKLMTLRAAEVLREADVVAHFAKAGRRGIGRAVVDEAFGPSGSELALEYPVTTEIPFDGPAYAEALGAFYADAAARVAACLEGGQSVAVVSEGDPFFYGSYMHLHRRLADRWPTEVVAGVTGMSACWTRAGIPITWGDDVLCVIPGTLDAGTLADRLRGADAVVVMKLGGNLPKVRAALADAGLLARAVYVERGSMAGELVRPLSDLPVDHRAPYFAMVLVPGDGRRP
jgi:precorrin-2/cobalt-factor-2 C20-methyltransferase